MCGISLIIAGIKIDLSSLDPSFIAPTPEVLKQPLFSEDDIKAALQRRGPDSLGTKNVVLNSKSSIFEYGSNQGETELEADRSSGELRFIGATLQLRGINSVIQPLVDSSGNVLVYNGEIFGGIHVGSDSNDTEILMQSLGGCCSCFSHKAGRSACPFGESQSSVPELLSQIKGPWALIFWQETSKTLWFGRDAFGRRSLLVHWPTPDDSRLLLSSVSPSASIEENHDFEDDKGLVELDFWEELPCGVYSISIGAPLLDRYMTGKVTKHEWTSLELKELILWERTSIQPKPDDLQVSCGVPSHQDDIMSRESGSIQNKHLVPSQKLLIALKESVMRRTTFSSIYKAALVNHKEQGHDPVAVLFSGGIDSMILAALLHQCIDSKYGIDLLNVSFDGQSAPDRISARAGLMELQKISPVRRWKLIEIDANMLELTSQMKLVMSLINPAKTYMDLNIGIALWMAAGGDGWVYEWSSDSSIDCRRVKYKSEARILLVGSGADEQCAGYGRHRTKYRNKSWLGLHEEMKLDMQRIWKRNLGRDDRCIADNSKEARFPFLDEDVIRTLLDMPLWEIADLDQPSGKGDKKILREVAQLLGLHEAASLPKRAIQFGSRIARESNKKNFGSNRAANQASAGGVVIYGGSK